MHINFINMHTSVGGIGLGMLVYDVGEEWKI